VQLQYWPLYTANRLDLAETLVSYIMQNLEQLHANAAAYSNASGPVIGIGGACPYNLMCPIGRLGNGRPMVGDGMWIVHNLHMHASRTSSVTMMRDTVYGFLKAAVNVYMQSAFEANGTLHLPPSQSPEYPGQKCTCGDTNFDIALFRWGLTTAIELASRFDPEASQLPEWQRVLRQLTEGPSNEHGLMIDNGTGFDIGHRHFSHLFSLYPLHLIADDPSK